jgi:hypothetical protein
MMESTPCCIASHQLQYRCFVFSKLYAALFDFPLSAGAVMKAVPKYSKIQFALSLRTTPISKSILFEM